MSVGLDEIRQAAVAIEGQVVRTPLVPAERLGQQLGCKLFLKLESLQHTGSFKDRGACVKLQSLDAEQRRRGVIAMSAGNHAQGVAYHARRLGIPATIVMPEFAPFLKVERTRGFGARVVLTGDTLDASAVAARKIAAEEGLTFVHPYDDPAIVAGQGTIGLEILADLPQVDALVVPIGGGGLIGGIALAAKALKPAIRIFGVEVELFPSMAQVLRGEEPHAGGTTIADGIAVKMPGLITREIVRQHVEEILLVDEISVEQAICALAEQHKLVAEGAGAAGLAALLKFPERFRGLTVAVPVCGGNIDVRLLSDVLARGLVRDGRLVNLRIDIVDKPGVLAVITRVIGATGGNIMEVLHQRMFFNVPAKQAAIDVVVETKNAQHVEEIIGLLRAEGLNARVLASRSEG